MSEPKHFSLMLDPTYYMIYANPEMYHVAKRGENLPMCGRILKRFTTADFVCTHLLCPKCRERYEMATHE